MLHGKPFAWAPAAETAYLDLKNTLISPQVLLPYDPSLPLLPATDSIKMVLDTALSDWLSTGQEWPILVTQWVPLSSTYQQRSVSLSCGSSKVLILFVRSSQLTNTHADPISGEVTPGTLHKSRGKLYRLPLPIQLWCDIQADQVECKCCQLLSRTITRDDKHHSQTCPCVRDRDNGAWWIWSVYLVPVQTASSMHQEHCSRDTKGSSPTTGVGLESVTCWLQGPSN